MTLLVPWLLFPAVLLALSFGAGLLVERASGNRLPAALRLPVGLALLIVAGQFTTMGSATARFTVPFVIALSAAGYLLSPRRRPRRPSLALIVLFLAVFAVYAAPVVLSGQATFTGYVKLDDTATFLGFTDQMMSHGRDFNYLPISTYKNALRLNIGEGYPIGAFVPLGVGSKIVRQDPAWTYQACLAFYAAIASLGLYGLLAGIVRSTWLRAFSAFVAAQAALLYAYALWGGMKEIAGAGVIALTAALVPTAREELQSARRLVPFAVASAATLGVLSVTGILWVGLLAIPGLAVLARRPKPTWRAAAVTVGGLAALAIPSVAVARQFVHYSTSNLLTPGERLGNLGHPLKRVQMFGVWLAGDFRQTPADYTTTRILIGIAAVAAIAGAVFAVRRRSIRLPVVALACVVAALLLDVESSPWLTGKSLATASPFLILLALAAAAMLVESRRIVEGAALALVIAGGVLWSNTLAYSAVWLAPHNQMAELQTIGKKFAGDGPTLMTEYQPYGVRHFLRNMDPEGASELRYRLVPLVDGQSLAPGQTADLDAFRYPDLLTYRTFVLRTSPVESRPAAPYKLVWQGTYYTVWERPATGYRSVIEHIPLGSATDASAVPSCSVVQGAAALATKDHAMLAAASTSAPTFVSLADGNYPLSWLGNASDPATITPTGPGTVHASVSVPATADYSAWLNGTTWRNVTLAIDGKRVGSIGTSGGLYAPLGKVHLTAGEHSVTLSYDTSGLAPGSKAPIYQLGPLALQADTGSDAVQYVQPAQASKLCGRSLDWLEVVGG